MKGESPKAVYFFVEKKHVNTNPESKKRCDLFALGDQLDCSFLVVPGCLQRFGRP